MPSPPPLPRGAPGWPHRAVTEEGSWSGCQRGRPCWGPAGNSGKVAGTRADGVLGSGGHPASLRRECSCFQGLCCWGRRGTSGSLRVRAIPGARNGGGEHRGGSGLGPIAMRKGGRAWSTQKPPSTCWSTPGSSQAGSCHVLVAVGPLAALTGGRHRLQFTKHFHHMLKPFPRLHLLQCGPFSTIVSAMRQTVLPAWCLGRSWAHVAAH